MKVLKKVSLILFCLIVFISCTTIYDLSNEKSASDKIVEDLETKKIVFIGEKHADVYPILFLTQNLERFYDAGLRYIFLEGAFRRLRNNNSFDFILLEIWMNGGWKYESFLFEEEVLKLNLLHKEDPIKVIFPEDGHEEFLLGITLKEQADNLNSRDLYAQKTIISILDKSKPEEKAIMFYGVNHGYKTMQKYYGYDWKACGVYLSEYYKDNFTNYSIKCFFPSKKIDISLENDFDCKVIPNNLRNRLSSDELSSAFDTICVTKKEVFGGPYAYIPTEDNIIVLINYVKAGIEDFENIKHSDNSYATNKYYQFLSSIYFLKYHFGNLFEFNYYMDLEELNNQVVNLENILFSDNVTIRNYLVQSYTIDELEKYSQYLFSYGSIEEYLTEPVEGVILDILYNLRKAKTFNQRDIWPQYWVCYFETEKAFYSQKVEDYKKALSEWDKLLKNDLLYTSPIFQIVYEKISFCEEKIGDEEKSLLYKDKENSILNFWDINCNKLTIYGN